MDEFEFLSEDQIDVSPEVQFYADCYELMYPEEAKHIITYLTGKTPLLAWKTQLAGEYGYYYIHGRLPFWAIVITFVEEEDGAAIFVIDEESQYLH